MGSAQANPTACEYASASGVSTTRCERQWFRRANSCLPVRYEQIVHTLRFRVQHIAHRNCQAAVACGAAHANQVTPLPVQQGQPRRPQHREIQREQSAARVAHVPAANQLPQCFVQRVVSSEAGAVAPFANAAQEEATLFVRWSMWHEAFGESNQPFKESWDR